MIKGNKDLWELRDQLELLTDSIREIEGKNLPYFYRCFDTMKNNIEIFLHVGCDDIALLLPVLERDWQAAHKKLIGVQYYDPHEKHPDADPKLCFCFVWTISKIGRFFDHRMSGQQEKERSDDDAVIFD